MQREAVAALLNASNPNVNFKYSVSDILWKVKTAYATGMYQFYADCLFIENNRGGDITTGTQTPDRIEEIRTELTKQIFAEIHQRNMGRGNQGGQESSVGSVFYCLADGEEAAQGTKAEDGGLRCEIAERHSAWNGARIRLRCS
ncbi:hypothetical protein FACS18942_04080 [Planctomycetales bacterium]|nr:hypothetical protein FACS18942_04080 [Planctomycetales bacterium]GHT34653.1 hypothetical protein FACS189427_02350 [Planctomycetales bacterium]